MSVWRRSVVVGDPGLEADIRPVVEPKNRMLLRLLSSIFLLLGCSFAQEPRSDDKLDSNEKKKALARVQRAIADERRPADRPYLWTTTPRAMVIYYSDSDKPADLDAKAAAARDLAQDTIEAGFDICERILPPHEKCAERFAIFDSDRLLSRLWVKEQEDVHDPHAPDGPRGPIVSSQSWRWTQAETFVHAQQQQLVSSRYKAVSLWAIYEKAWFGDMVPANWFTELAIERLSLELKALEESKGRKGQPAPFSKQDARSWLKLSKSELDATVARFTPGKSDTHGHGESMRPDASAFVAMFLGHGQVDLGEKFEPSWSAMMSVYATSLLADGDEELAVKLATEKLDRKALVASMTKWAKLRTK